MPRVRSPRHHPRLQHTAWRRSLRPRRWGGGSPAPPPTSRSRCSIPAAHPAPLTQGQPRPLRPRFQHPQLRLRHLGPNRLAPHFTLHRPPRALIFQGADAEKAARNSVRPRLRRLAAKGKTPPRALDGDSAHRVLHRTPTLKTTEALAHLDAGYFRKLLHSNPRLLCRSQLGETCPPHSHAKHGVFARCVTDARGPHAAQATRGRPVWASAYRAYLGGRTFIGGAPQSMQMGLTGRAEIVTSSEGSISTLGLVGSSVGSPEIL